MVYLRVKGKPYASGKGMIRRPIRIIYRWSWEGVMDGDMDVEKARMARRCKMEKETERLRMGHKWRDEESAVQYRAQQRQRQQQQDVYGGRVGVKKRTTEEKNNSPDGDRTTTARNNSKRGVTLTSPSRAQQATP